MEIILYSIFSGILGGSISVFFWSLEGKNQTVYFIRKMLVQMGIFAICFAVIQKWFINYELSISFVHLSSSRVFFLIYTLGFLTTKMLFQSNSDEISPSHDMQLEEYVEKFNE